ncbi:MAG: alpha/beta fold hydrolase [Acholeplasmataceae bacterium]
MELKLKNVTLNYDVTGSGQPLILIHGNQESLEIFDVLTKTLKSSFKIYRLDSRNHGKSSHNMPLGYELMTQDVHSFIEALDIKKPSLFGFSDGGIVGLMLAIQYPDMLDKLIIAGTNTRPSGMRYKVVQAMKRKYNETKSLYYKLMITEPFIKKSDLRRIKVPVLSFIGEKDLILRKHAKMIVKQLKYAMLIIIPAARHEDYVVDSDYLAPYIKTFLL